MSSYTIALKGDTTTNWENSNRVLAKNELGIERDVSDNVVGIKIGDGTTGWNSLGYMPSGGSGSQEEYSTTPVQIGTWVDGSPVYRDAIDILCANVDAETYGTILMAGGISFEKSDSLDFINFQCTYQYNGNYCICTPNLYESGMDFNLPDGVRPPSDQTECTDERFIGFVEYIYQN